MKISKIFFTVLFSFAIMTTGTMSTAFADKEAEVKEAADLNSAAEKFNKKQKHNKRKVICKKEAQLGTRVKRKVCRTVGTMEQEERDAKQLIDDKTRVLTERTS